MISKILPDYLVNILSGKLNFEKVYELRFRTGKPVMVNYGGRYMHLTLSGVSGTDCNSIKCDKKLLESIVYKATDHSLYAVNDQLKHGFITISGGIRLGICGELVTESNAVRTVKNFSSVNIRVPHEIRNCSLNAFKHIVDVEVHNTLIISPPGGGKTTFIRDFARNLSEHQITVNTLIIDERSEIAAAANGIPQLDVGKYSDVFSNCSKAFGFEQGIRAMRPDVIITDELANKADLDSVGYALSSGVKIIATAHAYDHLDLSSKTDFESVLKRRLFDRYIVLSGRRGPGTYEGIYDAHFNCIYFA